MTLQSNSAQQPPHDAARHGDPLALLATLARQRGSDDALHTLNIICRTLADRQSLLEIERVVRALQAMADAGSFTRLERLYLITAVLDVGISLRLVSHPHPEDGLSDNAAVERRHDHLPWPKELSASDALEHERLQGEIDSITRNERVAAFSSGGETDLAYAVLHEADDFELLRRRGLGELTGERDIDAVSDEAEDGGEATRDSLRSWRRSSETGSSGRTALASIFSTA